MSWISDRPLSFPHRFCARVLKCGPIPKHIAIIMDGNRRYASKENIKKFEGHSKGFNKLAETLVWCRELGITEVTVYAFSIENFKRSPEEVNTLIELATEKYKRLLDEMDKIHDNGICIRVVGNLELIPAELRCLIAQAVLKTKDNNRAFLNVAFAYTARDEITEAIRAITKGIETGEISPDDVNEDLVTDCMYSCNSPQPDILVRTSGEVRFSDFLLWQIYNTSVIFTKVLWPEFSIWHLFACIFQYQRCYGDIQEVERKMQVARNHTGHSLQVDSFLDKLNEKKLQQLQVYAQG